MEYNLLLNTLFPSILLVLHMKSDIEESSNPIAENNRILKRTLDKNAIFNE